MHHLSSFNKQNTKATPKTNAIKLMTIFLKKEEILIFSLYFLELMTKAFLILMQLPKSFKQIKSDFGVSSLC